LQKDSPTTTAISESTNARHIREPMQAHADAILPGFQAEPYPQCTQSGEGSGEMRERPDICAESF
jgi:hypothetical protein